MKTQIRTRRFLAVVSASVVLGMGALLPGSALAAGGPPLAGACNMLLDPTMMTVPMIRNGGFTSPGSAGMFLAVANSTTSGHC